MDEPTKANNEVLCVRFTPDGRYFLCGTNQGIRLYMISNHFDLHEDYKVGRVEICGFAINTSVWYFVSGGNEKPLSGDYVQFVDMIREKVTARLKCAMKVMAVCMRPDRVVVSSWNRLSIYSFPDLERLIEFPSAPNPAGLLDMTQIYSDNCSWQIIIYPGDVEGSIDLLNVTNFKPDQCPPPVALECHDSELACIALNKEGTRAATAADGDNFIKIWDTVKKTNLLTFISGSYGSIFSLAFDSKSDYLCYTDNKGLGQVFRVNCSESQGPMDSSKIVSFIAHWKIVNECRSVCAFGDVPDTVNFVTFDGYLDSLRYEMKPMMNYGIFRRIKMCDLVKKPREESSVLQRFMNMLSND